MIVVDASVFAKLLIEEPDSHLVRSRISAAIEARENLLAPTLLIQEALLVALRWSVSTLATLDMVEALKAAGFAFEEPKRREYELACDIARHGNPKSGYPQLQDAIYHAMAIARGGVLVTADRRHIAKAASFGSLKLLADWAAD